MKKNVLITIFLSLICSMAQSQETVEPKWLALAERFERAIKENKIDTAVSLFYLEGLHEDYPPLLHTNLKRIAESDYLKVGASEISEKEKEEVLCSPITTPIDPIGSVSILLAENRPSQKDGFYVGLKDGRYYLLPLVPRAFIIKSHNQSR
jgi:hypothetical protein